MMLQSSQSPASQRPAEWLSRMCPSFPEEKSENPYLSFYWKNSQGLSPCVTHHGNAGWVGCKSHRYLHFIPLPPVTICPHQGDKCTGRPGRDLETQGIGCAFPHVGLSRNNQLGNAMLDVQMTLHTLPKIHTVLGERVRQVAYFCTHGGSSKAHETINACVVSEHMERWWGD